MNRNVKAVLFFVVLPPTAGFLLSLLMAVVYATLDADVSAEEIFKRSYIYVGGIVAGWWMFGGNQ